MPLPLKALKNITLPPLVLAALNSVAAILLSSRAQTIWLFKGTKGWAQVAAVLTFTEACLFFLMAGAAGMGGGEKSRMVQQVANGVPVKDSMEEYQVQREKSIGQGLEFAAIGVFLILLTLLLNLFSQ
jgi:hypothetical protein